MLKPLHDYVVLEKVKEEVKTESGIILTTKEAKDEPSVGKVVAVGPGKTEDGKKLDVGVLSDIRFELGRADFLTICRDIVFSQEISPIGNPVGD